MTIRRAGAADLEAIRSVGRQTWPATYGPIAGAQYVQDGLRRWWSAEAVTRSLSSSTTYVAEQPAGAATEVVGVATVGTLDGCPMLWKLYVVPPAQGTGVGSALLAAVLENRPTGADALQLDCLEGNDRASAFYRHHGFLEQFRHGAGPREIRMRRPW